MELLHPEPDHLPRPPLAGWQQVLDAVLYSSVWLSLAALGLMWATFLFWGVHISGRLGALIFTATLFLYNLDSVLPYKHGQLPGATRRKQWIRAHRPQLLGLTLVAGAVAAGLYLTDAQLRPLTLFGGHLAVISVLYSMPLWRRQGRWWALRDLPLLKVFLIAYVWSAVTVWIPALYLGRYWASPVVLVLFARRFLLILAVAFVFDIRDYSKDLLTGTRTFPGLLGIRATKWLGLAALLAAAVLVPPGVSVAHAVALVAPLGLMAAVTWYAEESRPDYYFALLTDGVMVVQFVAVWLAVGR
ncbi:UbiA prenyltransferase family protein [Hymenobacter actinosclerus]|uniref:UbiA prenyltransferase family protein n=1 Tax=Hymenobacter actinosclerus TaxID=82805 RepID=A0A1H9Z9N1_9BACT|nr:UbiA family prenyltransferase [Hymenobacter actinosclerus]SES78315.1 UbiA prenyltransferase family protein [Hymenobacter actinosclerus]